MNTWHFCLMLGSASCSESLAAPVCFSFSLNLSLAAITVGSWNLMLWWIGFYQAWGRCVPGPSCLPAFRGFHVALAAVYLGWFIKWLLNILPVSLLAWLCTSYCWWIFSSHAESLHPLTPHPHPLSPQPHPVCTFFGLSALDAFLFLGSSVF